MTQTNEKYAVLMDWKNYKEIQRFSAIPLKIPVDFLRELQQRFPKCLSKHKRT